MIRGHGVDLVEIEEFAKLVEDDTSAFLINTFTAGEKHYAAQKANGFASSLAAAYAAKEAVLKALESIYLYRSAPLKKVSLRDIELVHDHAGRPHVMFYNEIKILVEELQTHFFLSLTHEKNYALASVILV